MTKTITHHHNKTLSKTKTKQRTRKVKYHGSFSVKLERFSTAYVIAAGNNWNTEPLPPATWSSSSRTPIAGNSFYPKQIPQCTPSNLYFVGGWPTSVGMADTFHNEVHHDGAFSLLDNINDATISFTGNLKDLVLTYAGDTLFEKLCNCVTDRRFYFPKGGADNEQRSGTNSRQYNTEQPDLSIDTSTSIETKTFSFDMNELGT